MRRIFLIALLTIYACLAWRCTVPVVNGWVMKVGPGERSGEILTWGFKQREADPEILEQIEALYERDRADLTRHRFLSSNRPPEKVCGIGQKTIFQRDDYIEYFSDEFRQEKVYTGCRFDGGGPEYWRAICAKEEEVENLVDYHCFRYSPPPPKYCRFGQLAFIPSLDEFLCLEQGEVLDEQRDFCPHEIGFLHVGEYFFQACLKLKTLVFRELVRDVYFIQD